MDESGDAGGRHAREWWIPTVSLMTLGALTAVVWIQVPVPAYAVLDILLPAAFVGVATWRSLTLRDTDVFDEDNTVIRWYVAGLVVMACLGLWPVLLRAAGQSTVPVGVRLLTEIMAGGLFGLLVGVYSVRARRSAEQATAARVEQELLERQQETTELLNRTLRHQLLNSLTVVRGRGELVAAKNDDDTEQWGQTIVEQTDRMVETVDDIGQLTRTLTGDTDLEPIELAEVVERAVATARETFQTATITVESLPDCTVRADELLVRALENVLENAVVHNDQEQPTVVVDAGVTDGNVVVTVADDGPGIPETARDRVLDANERGLESDGDGLGLFMTASVLRQYGGGVRLGDADLGGTVVRLTVPLVADETDTEIPGIGQEAAESGQRVASHSTIL